MVKKVKKVDLNKEVSDKLKNLFLENRTEYVVIGENIYELYPLPAITTMQIMRDLALLQEKLNKNALDVDTEKENIVNIFKHYIKGVDEEDWNKITQIQLNYLTEAFFRINLGITAPEKIENKIDDDVLKEISKQSKFQLG